MSKFCLNYQECYNTWAPNENLFYWNKILKQKRNGIVVMYELTNLKSIFCTLITYVIIILTV